MKNKKKVIFITIILLILSSAVFAQQHPRSLKFADIEFVPVKPDCINIKKGVDLYCSENKEIPVIKVTIILKTGRLYDPKEKEGIASLTLRLMKNGGTQKYTPEKLEEKLDFLGSSISVSVMDELSRVDVWALKKNFSETWEILMDMLVNPAFDENRFDLERKKDLEAIRRRWDDSTETGEILFDELIYGKGFPEVRRTTKKGLESITLADIKGFYNNNIRNSWIVIAFSGDFETKGIKSLLHDSFKNWDAKKKTSSVFPKASLASKPGIYFVDKEDMSQAVICIGHLGINRLDVNNVEIKVLNLIFGTGGWSSRLWNIRSDKGLAYVIYGYVGDGRDIGVFFNYCQTKNQSVKEAILAMKKEVVNITKKKVDNIELTTAKMAVQNSFVHEFDNAHIVLIKYITKKLYGFADDYLNTFINRIKKVDENQVLEMAKRTINPDNLIILVVGKKSEVLEQLKALDLGEVIELPLPKE